MLPVRQACRFTKTHAFDIKESVNAFVIRAINETMERDKNEIFLMTARL